MRPPKMFEGKKPTNAQRALREIANATDGSVPSELLQSMGGLPAYRVRNYITSALIGVHWIECRNSGPRGGKRYFITDMGRHVLDLIDKDGMHYVRSLWLAYPEMLNEMRRLGIEPEESF